MSQAIDQHGVLKGGYLGVKRLARCHPWSKHIGHDPVPEKFEWLTKKNKEQTHA
jgi:putative component of membrane protein insertase Oxa1/YidC/SpoIIIJ protein YidD|tara:strand:- start:482 stop:643 length:162 start_codon:yes stop_codon:yes gene_type:complete